MSSRLEQAPDRFHLIFEVTSSSVDVRAASYRPSFQLAQPKALAAHARREVEHVQINVVALQPDPGTPRRTPVAIGDQGVLLPLSRLPHGTARAQGLHFVAKYRSSRFTVPSPILRASQLPIHVSVVLPWNQPVAHAIEQASRRWRHLCRIKKVDAVLHETVELRVGLFFTAVEGAPGHGAGAELRDDHVRAAVLDFP